MPHALTLISHPLCPYVQRAAIALAEKGIAFERVDIDLADKPGWFLQVSPLGKTPVLLVDGQPIFESAVICEYLDETVAPRLHPQDALARARHRGWMEFGSVVLNAIGAFYSAPDEAALAVRAADLQRLFTQVDAQLAMRNEAGPYFVGADFTLVDAVFGPVFRYFDVFDAFHGMGDLGVFTGVPRVAAWRKALAARPSVAGAVGADYGDRLRAFVRARQGALAARMAQADRATPPPARAAAMPA
ncbi:MAG: glutathione S-transferase family protein [Pseudomonadota bacterium]